MKSYTPEISWHNRDPIYSVDIQQKIISESSSSQTSYYRLATCGSDSHLIIWRIELIESGSESHLNKLVDVECLADLTRHERPINVVRFSPDVVHDMLAAGDDDNQIIIWKRIDNNSPDEDVPPQSLKIKQQENNDNDDVMIIDENIEQSHEENNKNLNNSNNNNNNNNNNNIEFDGSEIIAKENWKPFKYLRGHLQDVCDLCWSYDGKRLISGSVDNRAIVWDISSISKLYIFENEHRGFVQGVAWDPLNKYLATISADRSLRIINLQNKKTQYRVYKMPIDCDKTTRLFYDDTLRSFCRRLTFTPNGEFLIVPSGILEVPDEIKDNEGDIKFVNTTYLFERKSLNKPTFYFPSQKYTIAVRCCPQLFKLNDNIKNNFEIPYRIVFAVATQDSVLFYDTQQELPFAQVSQIHYLRLTDISWSHDGRLLMISSTDGFATFVKFEKDELGVPYDGPKFQELENSNINLPTTCSPDRFTKLKNSSEYSSPEVDKQGRKLLDAKVNTTPKTPSIKAFFKTKLNGDEKMDIDEEIKILPKPTSSPIHSVQSLQPGQQTKMTQSVQPLQSGQSPQSVQSVQSGQSGQLPRKPPPGVNMIAVKRKENFTNNCQAKKLAPSVPVSTTN